MKARFTKEFMKAAAALLVVFLAGAGVGYVGGLMRAEHGLRKHGGALAPREARLRRGGHEGRFMRRLARDLNLNPAQEASVNRALERHYERIREIRNRMRPQIVSLMREVRRDVRSFLDGDQKVSFDRIVERFEKRRERRRREFRRRHPGAPISP